MFKLRFNNPFLATLLMLCCSLFHTSYAAPQETSPINTPGDTAESATVPVPNNEGIKVIGEVKSPEKTLAALTKTLQQREVEHGPYHISIASNLSKIADIHFSQQDYEQAHDALMRALEVQRISAGLYDAGQVPIILKLLNVNRALGKWYQMDKDFELLYWLQRRIHGEKSAELLPVLQTYIDWKMEAINNGLLGEKQSVIRKALKATKRVIDIMKDTPDEQHNLAWYRELAKNLRYAERVAKNRNPGP